MKQKSTIQKPHNVTLATTQMDLISELLNTYKQPLINLFEEAVALNKAYVEAENKFKEYSKENFMFAGFEVNPSDSLAHSLREQWKDKYKHDRSLYLNTLANISKYMYATIRQVEMNNNNNAIPELTVRVKRD